jgi:hypothetical protein
VHGRDGARRKVNHAAHRAVVDGDARLQSNLG